QQPGHPGTAGSGDARGRPAGLSPVRDELLAEAAPVEHDAYEPESPRRQLHCSRADAPEGGPAATAGAPGQRRYPPAPLPPGTGAALTPVLTEEGPRGSAPRGPSHDHEIPDTRRTAVLLNHHRPTARPQAGLRLRAASAAADTPYLSCGDRKRVV